MGSSTRLDTNENPTAVGLSVIGNDTNVASFKLSVLTN
eukprot:SAG31_NODE_1530_length_7993_cov_7.079807_10_plen_37_part_01